MARIEAVELSEVLKGMFSVIQDPSYQQITGQFFYEDSEKVAPSRCVRIVIKNMHSARVLLIEEGIETLLLASPWYRDPNGLLYGAGRKTPDKLSDAAQCLTGPSLGVYHITESNALVDAAILLRDRQVIGTMRSYIGKLQRYDQRSLLGEESRKVLSRRAALPLN
jgi:hypothetical protein